MAYLVAVAATAAAAGLTQLTWPFFELAPISLFTVAMMTAAWYGGLGPGLVATFLGLFVCDYIFVRPYFAFWPPGRADVTYLVSLGILGTFVSILSEFMHRARRQVETNLSTTQEREEQLRSLADSIPQLAWMADPDGSIFWYNQRWHDYTGTTLAEMEGWGWQNVHDPEVLPRVLEGWKHALATEQPFQMEFPLRGADGGFRTFLTRVHPLKDHDGRVVRWFGTNTDIEESKRAENLVRASESRLSGIIDSAMDAIITIDAGQRIQVFNRAAEAMFLCPAADAIGQSIERFIPERFRPTHADHIGAFGATGVTTRSMAGARSVFGLRSDGTEFPLEASISQIESGGVKLFTVIMRDVTERHRAENRFRQVIEHAPNGMVMIDGHGHIELVNAQVERSFGYESTELIGQPIEILVPERFRAHHPAYRDGFIANPSTRSMGSGRDLFGLRKDGTEFPVEIGLNPIQTDSGPAILGTIVDITERKLAEERLWASESRLGGIIESARDAIITVDRQQRIQVFNHAAEAMFRCPASEALGDSLERFLPERFRATHSSHIQAFGETGISSRAMAGSREIYGLRTDGTEFPLEASISQIEAEGQKLFTVILRDVSEHRRAEERFRQVIEHAPNGMVMVDGAALITLVNAQIEKSFGYSRDELIGQPIEILIPDRFHRAHPRYRDEFIAHPAARPMGSGRDLFGRRKDGTEFPVEIGLNPVETEKGTMILGTVVDITERKQIEDALRASEGRLRIVTDNARVGLVMVNRDRRYTFANNAYAEILDLPNADIVGLPVAEVLGSMYASQVAPKLDRAFGGERVVYELHRKTDDGYRHYAVSYEPMQTDTEESLVVVVITDITERKQAEEELAQQKAQLRVIFDNMTEGITVLDRERNIVEANAAGLRIQKMTGSDLDPLAAVNLFDVIALDGKLIPPEQWPSSRAFRGDFVQDYEFALRRRDSGVQINLEINSAPIVTEAGETGQIMLSMRDVTQRRQTEARYRTLFEHAPDGIAITSSSGSYLEVNPSFCRMLGYERSEMIGMHSSEILAPTALPYLNEALDSIRSGTEYPREWILKRKDGSVFPADIIATLMPDGNLLGVVRDISQRKLNEEKLNEQAKMLDLATVLVRDPEGRLMFWNTGAAQMYGWSESEAVGRITHDLLRTEFPIPVDQIQEQVVENGSWAGELVHYRRSGRRIFVASRWILHRDSLGNPKAIIEVNSDITAQKSAEVEVRRLNAELETRVEERTAELRAVNKELEAFSYSVSHDLRAPLRHINGFSLALLEDYGDQLDDEGKNYLQEVRAASQEMAQLIDDVLQLARVTRAEMIREEVDLSALAEKIVGTLRTSERDRIVTVDLESGLVVRGDKRLLQIALTNLLGNAWKFTSKTDSATIALTRESVDGEAVFCVRDNGAGFDQTFSDKLFRAFQRLHTGAEFEGTGIGLATVQRIVNRHGGRVWAQGKVGSGASFFFTLPER